jgi:diguanylate cyclase (GGDEF)-like protein
MASVVVIDDRVTNRNVLARLASSVEEGVRVKAFACPQKALDWLAAHPVDLLISDYKMPGIDGATLIRRFRALPGAADVPAVVITVHEDRQFRYAALDAGATDFLISPVDPTEFRARARNLLTLRKQQRLLEQRAQALRRELDRSRGGEPADPDGQGCDLELVLRDLPAVVSVTDRNGRVLYANRASAPFLGDPAQARHRTLEEVYGKDVATRILVSDAKVLETGRPLEPVECALAEPDGPTTTLLAAKAPLFDDSGQVRAVVTCALDVTSLGGPRERRTTLSGLPCRGAFQDEVLRESRRTRSRFAIHMIDLDRFKGINDVFGLEVGDQLLRLVATRLSGQVPRSGRIAQLSGDAFVVLQPNVRTPAQAKTLAERMLATFERPFLIGEEEIHTGASIGITLAPGDATTVDQLLTNAEHAMYRAKASGRNMICFFARPMNTLAQRNGRLEHELRQAFAASQFTVHYQPSRDLRSGRLVGLEALLRWQHPERGLIRPSAFISCAEELGLIGRLTELVLERACRDLAGLRLRGQPPMRLSVNVSPAQLSHASFADLVEGTLAATGFDPADLELELTERIALDHAEPTLAEIRRLRQLGVTFSLDDFGTGYASLADARRLPVNRLKIDRAFVCRLGESEQDEAIVRAIVDLGHRLGLRTTAEGIETQAQLRFVTALGCDEAQGDLISPPMPADELETRLEGPALSFASG